jgi:aminoglycoside phosphotransferase (APT) family kinase protein
MPSRTWPDRHDSRVAERIHDDEPDTTEATVSALLSAQCPEWADLALTYLRTSGTDNAMWRVRVPSGEDVVVRLPRRPRAAANVGIELDVLQTIADGPLAAVVETPRVLHVGTPDEAFPHRWAVLGWLDGADAWTARKTLGGALESIAIDLAAAVRSIGTLTDMPVPHREPGERGGPIEPLLQRLDWWLDDPMWRAPELIDVAAVRRCAAQTLEVAHDPVDARFVHGDLIPGNLLVAANRLSAIIDWGSAGYADPAQDLGAAWAVFDERTRPVFREAVGADETTWLRARAFELEQAVGGVLYYTPRGHALGDVMARTLHRILEEA